MGADDEMPTHRQADVSEPEPSTDAAIGRVRWWDLAEIADCDARIFGPTAWTHSYYWAVMAQSGTAMFMARTTSAGDDDGAASTGDPAGPVTDGDLAGWIVMSAGGSEGDVMTIATTEAARGRGIGRSLLSTGIEWARTQGAHVVHLEVDEHNEAALSLYRSCGFVEWGRRPDYYPGADAILMQHRLSQE